MEKFGTIEHARKCVDVVMIIGAIMLIIIKGTELAHHYFK